SVRRTSEVRTSRRLDVRLGVEQLGRVELRQGVELFEIDERPGLLEAHQAVRVPRRHHARVGEPEPELVVVHAASISVGSTASPPSEKTSVSIAEHATRTRPLWPYQVPQLFFSQ